MDEPLWQGEAVTPRETSPDPVARARADLARAGAPFPELPERFLLVDVARQQLGLVEQGHVIASFPVSTAAAGVGSEAGSLRTPSGWHRIHSKIGADAPAGT